MIKEEYKRLSALLDEAVESKESKLEEILQEAVTFFEALRKEFPNAEKEAREEMIEMMTTLHVKLKEISKRTAEEAGMSEEDLSAYAENPSNFSPEQWQKVQETKGKLYDSARKFSAALGDKDKSPESAPAKPKKTIRTKVRRARRQDWTKS